MRLAITATLFVVMAVMLAGSMFYAGQRSAPQASDSLNAAPEKAHFSELSEDSPSDEFGTAELISKGIYDSSATYRCRAEFVPIQVPMGKTVQVGGATYSLSRLSEGSQDLNIKLPADVGAPTVIVNPAAHNRNSDLYPQRLLRVNLEPGGKGAWRLPIEAYATNYQHLGISDITICTK